MNRDSSASPCDTALLWTLVQQQEDPGHEAEAIAMHLESCESCRSRLADLGGDDTWWHDAREWLSQDGDTLQEYEGHISPLPPIDLGFLEPAAHPEMLGRIGRYEVEGLLGRGGMGVVLRARDSDLERSVAVKVLAPEWAASPEARRRFAREAQAAASVAHDNVIPIYNVEADARLPFLVMRYIPGMTLERWVHTKGVPDTATILRVAGQMADGLAAAHRRGLVHRDIKPGNVLVGENIERVWITDFGLARAADSLTLTRTGVIAGTPHYMSPEQARGESIDQRSDLFSLGCVIYFLCCGRPPFDADNTLAVLNKITTQRAEPLTLSRSDLPPALVNLVHQLLERDPDRRPPDCEEVSERLAQAQSELKRGRVAKYRRTRWRRRGWAIAVAASVLALASLGGGWLRHRGGFDGERQPSNPWEQPGDFPASKNVYASQASARIVRSAVMDQGQFRKEVARINQTLDQLDRGQWGIGLPTLMLDSEPKGRELKTLQHLVEQLSSMDMDLRWDLQDRLPRNQ